MAKLLSWTTVLLVLALVVAIAGVSFMGMSTQWLVIALIVSGVNIGRHSGATSTLAFGTYRPNQRSHRVSGNFGDLLVIPEPRLRRECEGTKRRDVI